MQSQNVAVFIMLLSFASPLVFTASAERFSMKPIAMPMAVNPSFEFAVDSSILCADCHENKFSPGGIHASTMGAGNHKVGIVYAAQNLNVKYLKQSPDAYLEKGRVVCTTCHDGYSEDLIGNNRHEVAIDSRGTLDCSSCHNI